MQEKSEPWPTYSAIRFDKDHLVSDDGKGDAKWQTEAEKAVDILALQ